MPAQIDYSERSLAQNLFDPGAWRNLLGDVSSVLTDTGTAWEQIEKSFGSQPLAFTPQYTPPPPPPPTPPTPVSYKVLIGVGCGILVLFWVLKK